MIKLIAIDLDGTLLNDQKDLSSKNFKALNYAHDKGVQIVICTGRPYQASLPIIEKLDFLTTEDCFITFNGAQIYSINQKELIYQGGLTYEDFCLWRQHLEVLNLPLNPVDQEWVYEPLTYQEGYESIYVGQVTQAPSKRVDFDKFDETEEFLKFVISIDANHLQTQMKMLPTNLFDQYSVVTSHPYQMEVVAKGVSKGNAVKFLADKIGLKSSEIMTIGDQNNDLSMIEMAGIGVAMENASDELKIIADYITSSNNQDGVAQAIYHWIS